MAGLRTALRLAPRAQFVRPAPVSRIAPLAQRRYASVQPNPATDTKPASQAEQAQEDVALAGDQGEDPNMNGNYPDPTLTSALPVKRQFRDPYADWWDPQERRNYGEPVHEDNDILGIFSPEEYTHFTPGWGAVLLGMFAGSVGVLCAVVYRYYPDKPAVSRTFPGGLEAELGGPLARRARISDDDVAPLDRTEA
ncbi:NADH:ubiquinone oxidoreductase subunit like [Lecanosticta acicola]|uniref:NADH:ubiquinone oxidoreductase subunit like n=1 Tax=Lecanosticta acicola TaxID=111012 RepID=A0AAI8W0U2_9PEZI|nr:NADH:ubiquinone oxidoreductase subunit like [Lecanosticta acicola]